MNPQPSFVRRLFRDSRGANLIEYLVLVGVVALLALGGWRVFGSAIRGKLFGEGEAVASLQAGGPAAGLPGVTRGPDGRLHLPVLNPKCFAAGTPVQTADGERPIEAVKEGDLVWSRDEITGAVQLEPVLKKFETPAQVVIDLVATRGATREHLRVTPGHRFWREGMGWRAAESLAPGDELRSSDGTVAALDAATSLGERTTVYNFEVQDFHTYFVGHAGLWVHNGGPGDCPGATGGGPSPEEVRAGAQAELEKGVPIINGERAKLPGRDREGWDPEARVLKFEEGTPAAKLAPNGVQYDTQGNPDFRPYQLDEVQIDNFTSDRDKNFAAARDAMRKKLNDPNWQKPDGYTWHEERDMKTMRLVPTAIHSKAPHTGGIAVAQEAGK